MEYKFKPEDLRGLAASLVFWSVLYVVVTFIPIPLRNKYCELSRNSELDIQNRVVSTVHGTFILFMAAY